MKKIIFKSLKFFAITSFTFLLSSCSVKEYLKNAILGNIPFVRAFIQKDLATYTSITTIKDEMKLVTAKQQLDFINILDGKDGRYLEVSTYEVRVGIDCSKIKAKTNADGNVETELPDVEIFSSSKIHSVVARSEAEERNVHFYEECIKPVNIAYEQKAKDYSVELGILEVAQEKAKDIFKNLTGKEFDIKAGSYKETIELPYLSFTLEIGKNYLSESKMEIAPQPAGVFNRDALVLRNTTNDVWSIRIGDSGRHFNGKFNDFYKNVFETNCNKKNVSRDRGEIFRYFDPMYPAESEVLSYASDNYRTFFLLNNGRVYYIDAQYKDEQTLLADISPSMVYLASSMRKIGDRKVDIADEYEEYVDKYFDVQEALRANKDRHEIDIAMRQLINSNVIRQSESELTSEEKYVKAVSDVKNLGRTAENSAVSPTDDADFNEITQLAAKLIVSPDTFNSDSAREEGIEVATKLDTRIQKNEYVQLALSQYLKAWFLQNTARFSLSENDRKKYESELMHNSYIASRPLIATMGDSERNEYYYKLFRNRLGGSSRYVDTASVIDDVMKKSVRGSNMFVYFNIPQFEEVADGDIYDRMMKINNGKEITNSFILVFNQREWDFGASVSDSKFEIADNDIHAIVLDDACLRLFLNVGSLNFIEKSVENIKEATLGKSQSPRYFYFGDWKNLRITPENVSIAGHSFATKRVTAKGKSSYRNTNDYSEKSVIAKVIDDLQHTYSANDSDYYYNTLCDILSNQIQHYVYEKIFRPNPRMIIDTAKDKMSF